MISPMSYPKIELHVHLEGTLRPEMLISCARRNGVELFCDFLTEQLAAGSLIEIWRGANVG